VRRLVHVVPANRLASAGTVCRAAADLCDVAETCSGTSVTCPADARAAAGTTCRPAAGDCDVAETCTGTSAACPADSVQPSSTVCRASAGACDVDEFCSGSAVDCPADAVAAAGTMCRAAAGECDTAETCDGASTACPSDHAAAAGTPCTADADACTVDACDGSGTCVHTPSADADGDGQCDAVDPCTDPGGGQRLVAGAKLAFKHVDVDPTVGDDGLSLSGAFDLPASHAFADIHVDVTGARIVVAAADGSVRLDLAVPGGVYGGKGTRGWKRATNGKSWTYQDKTGEPLGGIVKVQIADKSSASLPRRTKLAVTGKAGLYPVTTADVPLAVSVTLGTEADAAGGLCAEAAYASGECVPNGAHTTISCKH
jgi:hypothetical protein